MKIVDRIAFGIFVACVSLIMFSAAAKVNGAVAHAAPAATPDNCEQIASTGAIDVFYCQPDMGGAFYINSVGFMALED